MVLCGGTCEALKVLGCAHSFLSHTCRDCLQRPRTHSLHLTFAPASLLSMTLVVLLAPASSHSPSSFRSCVPDPRHFRVYYLVSERFKLRFLRFFCRFVYQLNQVPVIGSVPTEEEAGQRWHCEEWDCGVYAGDVAEVEGEEGGGSCKGQAAGVGGRSGNVDCWVRHSSGAVEWTEVRCWLQAE
jgi:hypothetical protein